MIGVLPLGPLTSVVVPTPAGAAPPGCGSVTTVDTILNADVALAPGVGIKVNAKGGEAVGYEMNGASTV